jgi:hypothetical protein
MADLKGTGHAVELLEKLSEGTVQVLQQLFVQPDVWRLRRGTIVAIDSWVAECGRHVLRHSRRADSARNVRQSMTRVVASGIKQEAKSGSRGRSCRRSRGVVLWSRKRIDAR